MLSGTRSEGAAPVGMTDQLMASLQPTVTWARLYLTITTRAAYIQVKNDVSAMTSTTEQYQLLTQLSPPWAGSLFNFLVAADWNRSWTNLPAPKPGFQRRIVGSVTLRLGAQLQTAAPQQVVPAVLTLPPNGSSFDRFHPTLVGALR